MNRKVEDARLLLEIVQNEMSNKKASIEKVTPCYERFSGWANEFLLASTERKKMIISQLVSRIEISKGYKINLELNMDYGQFCEGWSGLCSTN